MATLYLTPFGKDDPRLEHALEEVEPRIHFALNCGAKSCPPIKTFTSTDIDNELKLATGELNYGLSLKGVFSKPSGNHIVAPIFCFLS